MYYVPIYDPTVVYGPWPWPAYAPYYWYPPGYVFGAAVIGFGVGFFVGAALWSHYNWAGGGVSVNVARYNQFNRTNLAAGPGGFNNWQFNAAHRGTVGFQNATLRQQYRGPTGAPRTLQSTSQGLRSSTGTGTAPLNAKVNTNAIVNRNTNVNQNAHVNRNTNVNKGATVNRNVGNVSTARSAGRPTAGSNKRHH
jgi:hypothetical protein